MNKILLTSIFAAALTSAASAFTLDFSTLNNKVIGDHYLTQEGAAFHILQSYDDLPTAQSGVFTTGDSGRVSITVNQDSTVIIDYDESKVSYTGVFNPFGYAINDNGDWLEMHTGSYSDLEFTECVPEPSSTALLGLGSLALMLRRRR